MGLSESDVNNPRNFLRLHEAIENAFDKKRLYFERITTSDPNLIHLKVVVLDPLLLQEPITKGDNDIIHFNDINGTPFHYTFTNIKKPFMRLLAQHAKSWIKEAVKLDWIKEDAEVEEHKRRVLELARQFLEPTSLVMKRFENS